MAWLQLDPESIAARARQSAGTARVPTLGASVIRGALGFALVSVAGFAPWAFAGRWFYPRVGEAGLYAACAAVFIGLSGPAVHRLILGAGSLRRFYLLFTPAFALYAAVWTWCWLQWRGNGGGLAGLLSGTAAMGAILALAFGAGRRAPAVIAALFALNALGYYAGEWIFNRLIVGHQLAAMLLWGLCYGLGFGAGLGVAFHLCQREARARLAS